MFWRIYEYPRIDLFTKPTPLEKAVNIGRELGIDLFIKRDDVMELAFGGNKARKLEFILGDALAKRCNVVITRGSYYSNHVRLTAAAANKLGLKTYIVMYPPASGIKLEYQGNILLNKIFGAKIIHVKDSKEADKEMEVLRRELAGKGFRPYIIPVGGSTPLGVLGYALAVLEIMEQMLKINRKPSYIVHATGTGTTYAGLLLGLKLLGVREVKVIGIDIEKHRSIDEKTRHVLELVENTAKLLGVKEKLVSEDDVDIIKGYDFGGYGIVSPKLLNFIGKIACLESLLLDPVYTGKAMYALYDLVNEGVIKSRETVVFIHTGGTPLLFQFAKEFTKVFGEGAISSHFSGTTDTTPL